MHVHPTPTEALPAFARWCAAHPILLLSEIRLRSTEQGFAVSDPNEVRLFLTEAEALDLRDHAHPAGVALHASLDDGNGLLVDEVLAVSLYSLGIPEPRPEGRPWRALETVMQGLADRLRQQSLASSVV